ncbi:MAG: hypothetical protein ACHQ6U_08635 [Thermodesulfobacteriota bacterium]
MKRAILVLIMVLAAASVSSAGESPQSTVNGFYNVYLKLKTRGIPSAKDLEKYKPYLTPELASMLKSADEAEIKYKKETKGEVPPLVEGDVFTSLFEGADSFKVLDCSESGNTCSCSVEFKNTGSGDVKTFTWKDGVTLAKEKSGWLISDIQYKGNWDFAANGTLVQTLKSVISGDTGD